MICVNEIVTHVPERSYSNESMVEALSPYLDQVAEKGTRMPALDENFFQVLGVGRRAMFSDPFSPDEWWNENTGKYPVAMEAAQAYVKLMTGREPLGENDKIILITNTTDVSAPNMGYAMLAHLRRMVPNFVAPLTVTLAGEGCSGYISGLREADTFLAAFPERKAVIVTAELIATYIWHPELARNTVEHGNTSMHRGLAIQRLLFGDGCSASYVTREGNGHHFSHFLRWDNLESDDLHLLEQSHLGTNGGPYFPPHGFFLQQPAALFRRLVDGYLPLVYEELQVVAEAPNAYAIHTGSMKILKAVQASLDLKGEDVVSSANVLEQNANMNSTTGAAILASMPPGQRIFSVFFGVGFSLQAAY